VAEVGGDRHEHVGVHISRVHPRLGQIVREVEGFGAALDRQEEAVRADPRFVDAVVRLRTRLLQLVVRVVVSRVDRGRVVLVVVEVPPGDVVRVAVPVLVAAVREADDDVLGVDVAVAVRIIRVGEVPSR
ncbi:MAG: hypothetical protein M3331_03005, partial [Actinomycetota bacterium]|nr:hypothetical protein [Actinomycetota bacterium]